MHGGEVGGYVAENVVYPEEKLAIAVLTNEEASTAAKQIATALAPLLGAGVPVKEKKKAEVPQGAAKAEAQARKILDGLMNNKIDRRLFTDDANGYFTAQTIADFASSLAPLGPVVELKNTESEGRGGMLFRTFTLKYKNRTLELTTYTMDDGKLEQFLIGPM